MKKIFIIEPVIPYRLSILEKKKFIQRRFGLDMFHCIWLIDWCLMPTLAVYQLYCGVTVHEQLLHVTYFSFWKIPNIFLKFLYFLFVGKGDHISYIDIVCLCIYRDRIGGIMVSVDGGVGSNQRLLNWYLLLLC
jgi:hypothetical protein